MFNVAYDVIFLLRYDGRLYKALQCFWDMNNKYQDKNIKRKLIHHKHEIKLKTNIPQRIPKSHIKIVERGKIVTPNT